MYKGKKFRMKYFLLTFTSIVCFADSMIYIRAIELPALSENKPNTLECAKEATERDAFDAKPIEKAAAPSLWCGCVNKGKNAEKRKKSVNSKKQKELAVLDAKISSKECAGKEEKITPALESEESESCRNCKKEDINSLDRPMNRNMIYRVRAEVHSAPILDTPRKEYKMEELYMLNEIKNNEDLAISLIQIKNKEIADIKKHQQKHMTSYNLNQMERIHTVQALSSCYNKLGNDGVSDGIDYEYKSLMQDIELLHAEINELEEIRELEDSLYQKAIDQIEHMKKTIHTSRKASMAYLVQGIKVEKAYENTLKASFELLKGSIAMENTLLLIREKETEHLTEAEEEVAPLEELIGLHKKHLLHMEKGVDILYNMIRIQKNIIFKAIERERIYLTYDKVVGECEKQLYNA
ncbi:hypothetical protein NERG_00003 [Nematocida ausubeli]|uniref:Uncharacterized protein n=1 Tax=Nematocida ausubeli (strain ATCC PRA-371 / ERTm2) TaxID=1913371 RepID=H8Z8T3_NEMA1|nr:hypothetical protein NERG_00003 [Nematocida ausubeli]